VRLLRSGTGLQSRSQGAVLDRFGVFESPADDRRIQGFGVATLFVLTEKGCAVEREVRPGGRFDQLEEALIGRLEERRRGFSCLVTKHSALGFGREWVTVGEVDGEEIGGVEVGCLFSQNTSF
jgi:hypothetical protein